MIHKKQMIYKKTNDPNDLQKANDPNNPQKANDLQKNK
jgi:hypothetical protein